MPNIHQAILIGASVEKVYSAITSQEGLSGWWTPKTEAKDALNSVAHFPFGNFYFKEMKITGLKPLEQVKWDCIKGDEEWVGTSITFNLISGNKENLLNVHPEISGQIEQQESDEVTLLIFHHDNWKDYTVMFAECSHTWGQFLRSLKLLCETGRGKPWPNQHSL